MKILGISSGYHDATAALIINGKPVASSAEERFTRKKHDPSFPINAIFDCLSQANLNGDDLNYVVFHERPFTKVTRSLSSSISDFPKSLDTFLNLSKDAIQTFWIRQNIRKHIKIAPEKILFVPHHMSHASHAFITSPHKKAVVVTIDAVGEWISSGIFLADRTRDQIKIQPLDITPFPHSLGLFYSAMTSFLGFKVNDGECSTMALAAFGRPIYVDTLKKILQIMPDGSYALDTSWFTFKDVARAPVTKKFLDSLGNPRSCKHEFLFDPLNVKTPISAEDQKYADIACSTQHILQEAIISYMARAKNLSKEVNLCYSGGAALNCVANSVLLNKQLFNSIYIPPDPGDGGGAMGAALYVDSLMSKNREIFDIRPNLGTHIDEASFKELATVLDPAQWHRFSSTQTPALKKTDLMVTTFSSDALLLEWLAKQLFCGRIVGWCQGRAENGPRALGYRSILLRPDDVELSRRLSKKIKLRAPFRPYAVALTQNEAIKSLEHQDSASLSRWMQFSYKVSKSAESKLCAALHIDKTTRAQCVFPEDNPAFHNLLVSYGKLSGCEALLNTSFNESGFPLVNDSTDALLMFARTDLDILIIGNTVLEKRLDKKNESYKDNCFNIERPLHRF